MVKQLREGKGYYLDSPFIRITVVKGPIELASTKGPFTYFEVVVTNDLGETYPYTLFDIEIQGLISYLREEDDYILKISDDVI